MQSKFQTQKARKSWQQTGVIIRLQSIKMLMRKDLEVATVPVYLITMNHPNNKQRKEAPLAAAELRFSRV